MLLILNLYNTGKTIFDNVGNNGARAFSECQILTVWFGARECSIPLEPNNILLQILESLLPNYSSAK
jgi:hypothetical protein